MAIKDFEFLHGAVLTKILRKDIPTSLKLVETKKESWFTYIINDSVALYLRYRQAQRTSNHLTWSFTFNKRHLFEIKTYLDNNIDLNFALICLDSEFEKAVDKSKNSTQKFKFDNSEICLINRETFLKLVDLNSITEQRLSVYLEDGKSFRVHGTASKKAKELTISRNKIDSIIIPA